MRQGPKTLPLSHLKVQLFLIFILKLQYEIEHSVNP